MAKENIEIVYEDRQIIAINKPAGISVTADRAGKMNLLDYLDIQRKDEEKLKLVHRLDKDTSGIMIPFGQLPPMPSRMPDIGLQPQRMMSTMQKLQNKKPKQKRRRRNY